MGKYNSVGSRDTEAILKVLDLITYVPQAHDQSLWAQIKVRRDDFSDIPAGATLWGGEYNEEVSDRIQVAKDFTPGLTCGTTACVAGWTAFLAGAKPVLSRSEVVRNLETDDDVPISNVYTKDNQVVEVEEYAREVMGLTETEAAFLFSDQRERPTLIQLLKDLAKGKKIINKEGDLKKKYHWMDEVAEEHVENLAKFVRL